MACVAYAAAIFVASSFPAAVAVPQPGGVSDKVVHYVEFAILVVLVAGAIGPRDSRGWNRAIVLAFALAAAYGVSDEVHQFFVPSRIADPWDAVADVLGAVAGAAIVWWATRRRGTFGHLPRRS